MELSIQNRLTLVGLLPPQGKYEDLLLRKGLVEKLDLTQKEIEKIELKTKEAQTEKGLKQFLTWDNEKAGKSKEIEITEAEKNYVKKILQDKNNQSEITVEMMDFYPLFV